MVYPVEEPEGPNASMPTNRLPWILVLATPWSPHLPSTSSRARSNVRPRPHREVRDAPMTECVPRGSQSVTEPTSCVA